MMRELLNKKVGLGWLVLSTSAALAAGLLWWLVVLNAPPQNSVLITTDPGSVGSQRTSMASATAKDSSTSPTSKTGPTSFPTVGAAVMKTPALVEVYVSGAVAKPGVYSLPDGSRVSDALSAAGGALPEADLEQINLAARVADEEHITVGRKGEPASPAVPTPKPPAATPKPDSPGSATGATSVETVTEKVNINTATEEELERIPRIGPVLAQRIIAYRLEHGPFASVDELTNVVGIKEALLERLRPYITVGP